MTIDPRLVERRREVAEDRARRRVGGLVRILAVLGMLAAAIWLMLSPLLSVDEVTTTGVVSSAAQTVLAEHGIVAGTPMVLLRPDQVESALELDPWVADAAIDLQWPDRVVVRIEERMPVAWAPTESGWGWFAVDGVQLSSGSEPDPTLPWIELGAAPGGGPTAAMLGALEFASALPGELGQGARIRLEQNGELWAEVGGFQVRLGRPVEMREKALSLAALLEEQPAPGSILTLIAPTHPAITPPSSAGGSTF